MVVSRYPVHQSGPMRFNNFFIGGQICIMATELPTHSEILRLFGAIDDHKAEEIIELNPSPDELEVAAAYVAGMNDVMGKEHHPLTGKAAKIYEIVSRDETLGEDEYRRG